MKEQRISYGQWVALYWAGTLAPAAECLPGVCLELAGRGTWISVLLAGAVIGLVCAVVERWLDGRGAASLLKVGLGPVFGRAVLLIYMVWGVLLLALRLGLCAGRLLSAGYRDGSRLFFLTVLAALLAWIGTGRLPAFARAGQLFLAILLAAAVGVLLLTAGDVRLERLLPIWWSDLPYILKGSASAVGVLAWGLFLPFLGGAVEKGGRRWIAWTVTGSALLSAAQGVILGNLGVGLAGRVDGPFFVLAKQVGIRGAFQRIESVIAALWCFSDLVFAGVLVFALREMLAEVWERAKGRRWPGGLMVLLAWILAFSLETEENIWNRSLSPVIHLALCAIGVVFLGLSKVICGKKCGKKQILWSKRGEKRKI